MLASTAPLAAHVTAIGVSTLIAILLTAPKQAQAQENQTSTGPEVITLVVVGDVGLNRSKLPVDSRGVIEGKGHLTWSAMTSGIRDLVNGDLNFMNLETVVTNRNDLAPGDKGQRTPYLFRTHPSGVDHLSKIGFNLVSAANNHAYDYGEAGAKETCRHLNNLAAKTTIHFAGIGLNRNQAMAPRVFDLKGATVAFSSIGIVTNMIKAHRAGANKAGTMGYRFAKDWQDVTEALGATRADLRLLSIHFGTERRIATERKQLDEWRWAAREKDVDVIIGHHAHVVRGVEFHRGKLIFYGLGNFLIRGARDMGSSPKLATWGDYGLYAKVYLARQPNGRYLAKAIQVIPMTDMHRSPKRFNNKRDAERRIQVLNVLASQLDNPSVGSKGVRFRSQPDGSGLHCTHDANLAPNPIRVMCSGWRPPPEPSAQVRAIVNPRVHARSSAIKQKQARRRGRVKSPRGRQHH